MQQANRNKGRRKGMGCNQHFDDFYIDKIVAPLSKTES